MFRRLVNLPFSVAGRAARAFQEREDARTREKYGATQDPGDLANTHAPPEVPRMHHVIDPTAIRMDAATALAAVREGRTVVFVDIRATQRGDTVAGSVHMPLNEVSTRVSELSDDQLVIAWCDDGAASTPAVQFFRERGIEDAWVLVGGVAAWKAAGGRVVQS
jgi:rhodanese-related sulfurtransferase